MKAIHFPEANKLLTPPKGMTKEECSDLPVYNDGKISLSCWELSVEEVHKLMTTRKIWLWVWAGKTQPPVALDVSDPWPEGMNAAGGG